MKKVLIVILVIFSFANSEKLLLTSNGIGSRSLGLGNNFTALANDYSSVFWNPAGLAFAPVREIHASLGLSSVTSETQLGDKTTDFSKSAFNFSSAGLVRSLPTKQGGLAFAIGYSTPYSFADLERYSGDDVYIGTERFNYGERMHYDDFKLYTSGNMGLFTAAVGWQVAKQLGFGVSISYVYGKSKSISTAISHIRDTIEYDDGSLYSLNAKFKGIDIRFGGMYQITPELSTGIRIEVPQTIYFTSKELFLDSLTIYRGILKGSVSGAIGLAYKFPFSTISTDFQFRSPNPDVDDGDLSHWKAGAGAGIEVPIPKTIALLRAGYNWKQFDLFPHAEFSRDNILQIDKKTSITGTSNVNIFTAGATFIISDAILFELAYSNTRFSTQTASTEWVNVLDKDYSFHKGNVTVTIQY